MKKDLQQLFNHYIEVATEEEQLVLKNILEGLHRKKENPFSTYISELMQMEHNFQNDSLKITIPITPLLNNNLNIVHGGFTATLVDTTMGVFANMILPEGFGAVTTSLNIHYLSAGVGESLICKAKMEHKGSKTMVLTSDVFRSDGKKIAQATGSFFVIEKKAK
ncbi:PaaI family thioesterase [Cytobacillus sp. Hz8]|uniref:PaaI family thioesterase n=1 Tax=Cytobacillus sp. Hz8 TaxID=3347168 RepID=UPI0035E21B67